MTDAWDRMNKRAEDASDSSFVRLKDDKDAIVCAFLGDPEGRELFWDQKEKKYVPYGEEHAKEKKQITLRMLINVLVIKQGNGDAMSELTPPKVKVIEVNAQTFRSIIKARKKYGFDRCYFEVSRNGAKGDTNTTYSVLSDEAIDPNDLESMKSLKLHDLKKLINNDGEDGGSSSSDDSFSDYDKQSTKASQRDDSNDPITTENTAELIAQLKPLPREDLQKFLSRFGVKQIKALTKKDLDAARAFVRELAGSDEGETAEADPFA